MEIATAVLLKNKAFEFPRQGEGWPRPGLEQSAENLLKSAGVNDLGRTEAEEQALVDFYQQQSERREEAAAATRAGRTSSLKAAAEVSCGDIVTFVKAAAAAGLSVTFEEIQDTLGVSSFHIFSLRRRVDFDRRGNAYLI